MRISGEQYRTLVAYVLATVAEPVTQITGQYSNNDAFFEALGSYNVLTTCNTWTGDGLQAAGVKTSVWTPFAANVLANLELRKVR